MGGTIASLRGYVENRSGKVIAASVMTAHEGAVNLPVTPKMLAAIANKHGSEMNEFWQETFGYGIEQLTQGEAGHLRAASTVDAIRDRIATARHEGITRLDATGTQTPSANRRTGSSKEVRKALEKQANEAKSVLQETREQLYAQWKDPLDERQKAFNVSIRKLHEQRSEHDLNRPKGLFGFLRMKSWNAQSHRIDSELEKLNQENKQFDNERKEKLPALRDRADRMAREKHPKAVEVLDQWRQVQRKNAQKTLQELSERRNQPSKGRGR